MLALLTAGAVQADTFFPITSVTSDTAGTDFFPAVRMIEGPGIGFQAVEPHNRTSGLTWVTNAPNGGAGDYFNPLPTPSPRLVFDLGQERELTEISAWGYSDGNANGAMMFSLRFATAADGPNGFGLSVGYNPTFTITRPQTPRQSLAFSQVVTARYVELVPTDNFFQVPGGGPGGDRVGLGEIAFEDRKVSTTATLDTPATATFYANTGGPEDFVVTVGNGGLTPLVVTSATFSGANASAFSVKSLPGPLGVLETGPLTISVNPAGQPAKMEATLTIASNDPASPKVVTVRVQKPSEFYPILSLTGTTQGTDLFPEGNLIQGPAVGFDALAPHNALPGGGDVMLWVTNAPWGFPSNYFVPVPEPAPVFTIDLGEERLLGEISLWGYSTGNSNGMMNFRLRFATAADGPTGFGLSIGFAPELVLPFGALERQSLGFGRLVRARYVELTPLTNHGPTGIAPGGDRVGFGEVAFEVTPSVDPLVSVPKTVPVTTKGAAVTGTFEITNAGLTRTLNIASVVPGGANAALLTVTSFPATLAPGATGVVGYTFTPGATSGLFDTTFTVNSNDPLNPVTTVRLDGVVQNPSMLVPATIAVGPLPMVSGVQPFPVVVGNEGETLGLSLTNISFTGPQAASFSVVTNPSPVAAKSTASLVLGLDSGGRDGIFRAVLRGTSNDPLRPTVVIPVVVKVAVANPLAAWWPLDVDGSDASGNGHDGVAAGTPVPVEGANAATGGGMQFDGFSRFDVPFSPALNPDSFTVTLWALPDTAGGNYASPITSRDDFQAGVQTHGYILYNDAGGLWSFWTGDGDPGWNLLDGPAVTPGEWVHVALVYDALTNTKTLYLNGVVAATATGTVPLYSPNGTTESEMLHIGAGQDDGLNFYFTGRIDDVAVFRDSLPLATIEKIKTSGVVSVVPPALPAFRVLTIAVPTPGNVALTFESVVGGTYEIQRGTTPGAWTTLPGTVAGQAGTTSYTDATAPAGAGSLFYRVKRVN